jgi:hypothetical protein
MKCAIWNIHFMDYLLWELWYDTKKELEKRLNELGKNLVSELKPEGYWEGRLSSSALGVAVAVAAFISIMKKHMPKKLTVD